MLAHLAAMLVDCGMDAYANRNNRKRPGTPRARHPTDDHHAQAAALDRLFDAYILEGHRCISGPTSRLLAASFIHEAIKDLIDKLTVLEHAGMGNPFPDETALFKNAHGRRIPSENRRVKAHEPKVRHGVRSDGVYRLRHDAAAPILLAQPIAKVARLGVNAFSEDDPDAPYGLTVYLDGPMARLRHAVKKAKPRFGVRVCIGMRKQVREVAPDLAVVREANEGRLVASRPVANHAVDAFEPQWTFLWAASVGGKQRRARERKPSA
jgi:hypothetical protein